MLLSYQAGDVRCDGTYILFLGARIMQAIGPFSVDTLTTFF